METCSLGASASWGNATLVAESPLKISLPEVLGGKGQVSKCIESYYFGVVLVFM